MHAERLTSLYAVADLWLSEMVEPLEETRTEIVFATEPLLSSLQLAIPDVGRQASLVELDEIEVRQSAKLGSE